MDLLKDAAKQINLYEVKHYVRKAQNVAMNLTDMEAKVREATNNEPWGTSSTVKAQIAAGTYNYREREEILSFIFRRFTEKAANEWRQIYKSLELLDYLIKNGSERIIDDVRANMSLIQMLKSFHYIDSKGRDQGINVRNRAKNLLALLNDDALIRSERKKARANAKKFGGVSSAAYGGAGSFATGQGAAGFEDDDYSSRVFGDGGVYGARYGDTAEEYAGGAGGDDEFEEYEAAPSASGASAARSKATTATTNANATAAQQEPDLLGDLMDFGSSSAPQTSTSAGAAAAADDDDDFDDFQTAPSASAAAPVNNLSNNLANLYVSSPTLAQQPQLHQQQQQQQQQNLFQQPAQKFQPVQQQANYHVNSAASSGPAKPAPKEDAFSSLFSTAKTKTKAQSPSQPKATPSSSASQSKPAASAVLDDDFFSSPAPASSSSAPATNNTTTTNNNNNDIDLLSF
ncbi:hypothetical protein DIURU_005503 [Diutina rugosa]|uniref:ENTH domain-containing protein n=1 Tax=Diutina rugosa TaxID=5481 RepID=A0A642UH94_DIURU|nr:uncharacterized protein DIURU_005503 [Diutina rugosa]KAA8896990.1 hypothetical protein DIURU_005503 [Diutina rugosa]